MGTLQILLLILCIADLLKNKKILSPRFLFNFIFFITCSLYEWHLSNLQQELTDRTELILLNCVVFYNVTYYLFDKIFDTTKIVNIFKKIKLPKIKTPMEKRIKIARNIAIVIFIIELIYSKGCPVLWKFTGDSRTYFDFGIPSVSGAFYGLIICLGAYSLFSKSKDKYIYLVMGLLMISRQVIISILIEGIIYFIISNKNKVNYKKIGILALIVFVGFTLVGNFRSGDDAMDNVFDPKRQYEKTPDSIKWTYSYMTFSISNFNNLVSMTDGGMNHGASMLSELMPTVLLDKVNIKPKYTKNYLIHSAYNVSTYLPSIYLDFGMIGIIIFNSLMAILGYALYENALKNKSEKNILMYAVFAHNILLLFFINMFLYLPIVIQFLYIPLIFSGEKEKKKKRKKNVLLVGTDSNMSGASLCMVSLAQELKEKEYNPIIVLPSIGDNMLYDYINKKNIKCYIVKSYNWVALLEENKIKKKIKYKIKQLYNIKAISKIKKIISKEKIEIVHINSLFSYVGAKAALDCDVKLVWHIREILEYGHHADFYNSKYAYELINSSDKIITISKYVYDYYKKYLDESKMEIVYDGLEIEKYYNKDKKIFKNKKMNFMLAGTIQKSKGQEEFLKALKLVKDEGYNDFNAILIGYSNDENKEKLLKQIDDLKLNNEVKYLGFQKDILKYWNDTDIAFMCSSGEAFGRTTVEASLAGCLVIGADIGATSEIITDNKTGLLYESGNEIDLKDKIIYAINNKKKMEKIANDGREFSKEKFTSELTTNHIVNLYEEVTHE